MNERNSQIQLKKVFDPVVTVYHVSRTQKKLFVFNNIDTLDKSIQDALHKIERNNPLTKKEYEDLYKLYPEYLSKWIKQSDKYPLQFINDYIYQDDQLHIIRKKLMIYLSNATRGEYLLENNQQIWFQMYSTRSTTKKVTTMRRTRATKKNKNNANTDKKPKEYFILGYNYVNYQNIPCIYDRPALVNDLFDSDGTLKGQYSIQDDNTKILRDCVRSDDNMSYIDNLYVSDIMDEFNIMKKNPLFTNKLNLLNYLKKYWPKGAIEMNQRETEKNFSDIRNILLKNRIIQNFLNTVENETTLQNNSIRQCNLAILPTYPDKTAYVDLIKILFFIRQKLSMEIPFIMYQDEEWQNPYYIVYDELIKQGKITEKKLRDWFPNDTIEKEDRKTGHKTKLSFRIHSYDYNGGPVYSPVTIYKDGSVDYRSSYKEDFRAKLVDIQNIVDKLQRIIEEINQIDYRINNQIPENMKIFVPKCNYLQKENQLEFENIHFGFFATFANFPNDTVLDYKKIYNISKKFTPYVNTIMGRDNLKKNTIYFIYKRISNFRNKEDIFQFIDSLYQKGVRSDYQFQQEIQNNFFKSYQESLELLNEWKKYIETTKEGKSSLKDGITVELQNLKLDTKGLKDIDMMNRILNFFIKIFSIYQNYDHYMTNKLFRRIMSDEEFDDADLYQNISYLKNENRQYIENEGYPSLDIGDLGEGDIDLDFNNYLQNINETNKVIQEEELAEAVGEGEGEESVLPKPSFFKETKNVSAYHSGGPIQFAADSELEYSVRLQCEDAIPELDTCRELCNDKSYILRRLQRYDIRLFRFRDEKNSKAKNYAKLCNANHDRQPIVLSYDPTKDPTIEKGSFTYPIRAGSDPEHQYWYICPKVWCPYCEKPIAYNSVINIRKMKTSKDQTMCVTGNCPNGNHQVRIKTYNEGEDHMGGPIYPGYLPSEKHPDNLCMPCCFNENQMKNPKSPKFIRMKRCMGEEITTASEEKNLYILSRDKLPLDPERYGLLPIDVNNFFGTSCDTGFIPPVHKCYLRKGVKSYPNQSFLSTVLDLVTEDKQLPITMEQFRTYLASNITREMFVRISNGNLPQLFGYPEISVNEAMESFKKYILVNENITEEYLWDYLSQPNILYPEGTNLFIFHTKGIVCPRSQDYSSIYDLTRRSIFMIKFRKTYEPIYYVENNRKQWYFDGNHEMVKKFYKIVQTRCTPFYNIQWSRIFSDIRKVSSFKNEMEDYQIQEEWDLHHTIQHLLEKNILTDKNIHKIKQVIDGINKTIAIVLPNPYELFLPVKPSQIMEEYETVRSIPDPIQLLSYEKTEDEINRLSKTGIPYKIQNHLIYKNNVIGFILNTGRFILIDPILITSNKVNKKIPNKDFTFEPTDVETAIETKREDTDERLKKIHKWYFEKETYQRLRLELSKYLINYKNKKEELNQLIYDIDKSKFIKRTEIYQFIKNELDPYVKELENSEFNLGSDSGNGNKSGKKTIELINPNVRNSIFECNEKECREDPHLEYDSGRRRCVLRIFKRNLITGKSNFVIYSKMIAEELLNSSIKRNEIMYGTIPEILNKKDIKQQKHELLFTNNYQMELSKLFRDTRYQYIEKQRIYDEINPKISPTLVEQYGVTRDVGTSIESIYKMDLSTHWKEFLPNNYKVWKTPHQQWFVSLYLIYTRIYREIRKQNITPKNIKNQLIQYLESLTNDNMAELTNIFDHMIEKSTRRDTNNNSNNPKTKNKGKNKGKDGKKQDIIDKRLTKEDIVNIEDLIVYYYSKLNPTLKRVYHFIELKEFILLDDYQPCLIDIYFISKMYNINTIVLNKKINRIITYDHFTIKVDNEKPYLIIYTEIENNIIIYNQVKKDKINLILEEELPKGFREYLGLIERKNRINKPEVERNIKNKKEKEKETKKKIVIKKKVANKPEKKAEKKKIIIKKKK